MNLNILINLGTRWRWVVNFMPCPWGGDTW